jgi:GTPase involved in cell partitioning and DNA repair
LVLILVYDCIFDVTAGSAMTGKKGKDLYVKVPIGTIVKEKPLNYLLVSAYMK